MMLQTERLALRRFTASDVDNLLTLDGDTEVMRFLDSTPRTRADIEAAVLPAFLASNEKYGDLGYWVALTRADGAFVGWFGLRPVAPSNAAIVHWRDAPGDASVAELGFRLRRSAWGSGLGTEGSLALVLRAFTELDVREVVATTMAVNTGSRRVLEKVGLQHTRTVHVDWPDPLEGTEHGEVEYRVSRDDWLRATRPDVAR